MSTYNRLNSTNDDVILKILILGDSSVGKTSLLLKYVDGYFPETYIATLGVEFKVKKININGINISLQIWDSAGQERFRGVMAKSFMKGADGIIYTYDISRKSSFDNLKGWITQSEEAIEGFKKIIVGNKLDLEKDRQVTKESLTKLCQNQKLKGMEVSAKNNANVNKCFETLVKLIIEGKNKEELIEKYSEFNRIRGKSVISTASYRKKNKKKSC